MVPKNATYRGRLAPSPTGWLHLGHARTFWVAQERARAAAGTLVLRNDDLDLDRCRPEFAAAMIADLQWFGFTWNEGPDRSGPFAPYVQSERKEHYATAFHDLLAEGLVYPCTCSRKDVQSAAGAPHESWSMPATPAAGPVGAPPDPRRASPASADHGDGASHGPPPGAPDEPVYPGTCRPENLSPAERTARAHLALGYPVNWRFRVPDGEPVAFTDGHYGHQRATAGRDFGDFLVWRKDGVPSYQLACAVDDALMEITEVVRGADLIASTFRQILLLRALGRPAPEYLHCPLVADEHGARLAKRHDALALRTLRAAGRTPEELRAGW